MDRRILFILIMSLAVPYGCSMALLGTSWQSPAGLRNRRLFRLLGLLIPGKNGLFAESAWTWKIHRKKR